MLPASSPEATASAMACHKVFERRQCRGPPGDMHSRQPALLLLGAGVLAVGAARALVEAIRPLLQGPSLGRLDLALLGRGRLPQALGAFLALRRRRVADAHDGSPVQARCCVERGPGEVVPHAPDRCALYDSGSAPPSAVRRATKS